MKNTYSTNINLRQIDAALLILRVGVSAMMLSHGIPKLIMLFQSEEIAFADPIGLGPVASLGLAVFAEFICSVLVLLGLGTRLAVIPLIITMLTAFFVVHGTDAFSNRELSAIYLLIYIVLLVSGAGKYALDYYFLKKKK